MKKILKIIIFADFVRKKYYLIKFVIIVIFLTGKNRGPAHNTSNINVTQKDSNFIPFAFHNFSNYDCHMFFTRLVDLKKDKVKFEIVPKTNEEYIAVKYGCIRFIDSYRFLSESLDKLVKNLDEDDFKILKKRIS